VNCVRLLSAAAADAQGEVEILVVDNEGDPALGKALESFPVRYLVEQKPGSYAARNSGLATASGEIVAFTDSDCSPEASWIARAMETLSLHGADVAVGPVVIFPKVESTPTGWEVIDMVFAFPIAERVKTGGWGVTANLVSTRDCLDRAGHFDSLLLSGGDAAWCRKAVSKGFKLIYDPHLIVRHPARACASEHFIKARRVAGGLAEAARREGRSLRLLLHALISFIPPFNKWRKVWGRKDISASGRFMAMICLCCSKWAYGSAILKQVIYSGGKVERR
jgi:GT2 family glycosyltransferase